MYRITLLLPAALAAASPAFAQAAAPAPRTPAPMAAFDGTWRGPATLSMPGGAARTMTQTERVGPALSGAVRVIEGRSYAADGSDAGFNALGIVSPGENGGYEFRAYAQGRAGTFPMTATASSFEWSMPAGPSGAVHYTASVANNQWHEEGWYERGGQRVAKVFEMTLTRVGETDWPGGRPVGAR